LMKWGSTGNRNDELKELLSYVRYPLMLQADLLNIVQEHNELFESTNYLKKSIQQAFSFLQGGDASVLDPERTLQSIFSPKLRKTSNTKELTYHQNGDQNGVFYWIGTNGKTELWQNPHKSGRMKVSCSSPEMAFTRAYTLVNRSFCSTSFTSGTPLKPAYWAVDLGPNRNLICTYYTIQKDSSDYCVTDWNLEGSIDSKEWIILRHHADDGESMSCPGKQTSWSINSQQRFRYFRVIVAASSAKVNNKLALTGLELYGYLSESTPDE